MTRAKRGEAAAPRLTAPLASRPDALPIRRNTIGTQIRSVLRSEIIAGRLPPRTMLSEQDLSVRFGVSRTPIREALIKLSEENLVEIYPQYGSFVAPITLRDVFDSQFAREALECAAVEKAADMIDDIQSKQLRRVLDRQRALLRRDEQDDFFRADEDMHAMIMTIAGHGTAWHYVENAKAQMDRVRYLAMSIPRKRSLVFEEHLAIVDNLVARNKAGAVEAMRVHLRGIFRSIEILTAEKHNYFTAEAAGKAPSRTLPGHQSGRRRSRTSNKAKVK
ncbi:MAG TPA: GntR family transcriptional regulator [Pseudorhodoplanes sp.]|nr:GntR family transcriptional regulator [Pseudorhodoplanes sp.]